MVRILVFALQSIDLVLKRDETGDGALIRATLAQQSLNLHLQLHHALAC
jgi:hypothetical protein